MAVYYQSARLVVDWLLSSGAVVFGVLTSGIFAIPFAVWCIRKVLRAFGMI